MPDSQPEIALISWFGQMNYSLMEWINIYWWQLLSVMVFIGSLIGMTPLKSHHEHPFHQILFIGIRKGILWLGAILIMLPLITLYLYDTTMMNQLADSQAVWLKWFVTLAENNWYALPVGGVAGGSLRFLFMRYMLPAWSAVLRKFRNTQTTESLSDIRTEASKFEAKNFLPSKHYKKDAILIGLDQNNKPIHVPATTWYETNMQVIGPTRYGKGVIMGGVMDQAIRRGDCLFYIDPKNDTFAAHVMYQACKDTGRKFYYLTLHDEGIGKWAPFAGGTDRDALSRLETAFGLELTGDPGTDYYKSQEKKELERAFAKTKGIEGLKHMMEDTEANRINAELSRWSAIESLCPKKGSGFSIAKALTEGAVVYVQGSLDDSVIKTATKVFIAELIQETRRLKNERTTHLTAVVDEVSFLASKTLAQALATIVGFRANFVLAYQSQNDLLNLDDKSVNPKYVHQSINVNSQIKAVHGGADYETAEWAANLSGTIVKEVTKMEKTDISSTGGETWENQRTIGTTEENYINTNIVLTLPPRVCVFIQPRHLASICFSSFVPVKDMNSLNDFLTHKEQVYTPQSKSKRESNADENPSSSKSVSQAKPAENKKENAEILQFKKPDSPKQNDDESTVGCEDFFADVVEKKTTQKETLEANLNPSVSGNVKAVNSETPEKTELSEDEIEKKRARNRERKKKQKERKQTEDSSNSVSQAKPDTSVQNDQGIPDDFINDLMLASALKPDADTMSLLIDEQEED